jgi:hypothetical protein
MMIIRNHKKELLLKDNYYGVKVSILVDLFFFTKEKPKLLKI